MGRVGRHWVRGVAALLACGALATPAAAQAFKDITYGDFDRDQAAWNGKYVRIHAVLVDLRPVVQTKHWDREFFENAGITDRKYRRFTVHFEGQQREGLFPILSTRGTGPRLYEELSAIPKEARLTLWGRVKRMGDARSASSYGSAVTPSLLVVSRLEPGWVKDLDQYLEDLEHPELVEETVTLMAREGKAALTRLQAAAESKRLADRVRCAVLDAIGRIGEPSHASRLVSQLRTETAPRVRATVLVTLCRIDRDEALEQLGKLLGDPKSEDWAAATAVDLLAAEVADLEELQTAFDRRWAKRRPELGAAAAEQGDLAARDGRDADAERFYTVAVQLVPDRAATWLARGRVRRRLAAEPALDTTPEGRQRRADWESNAQLDFDRALDMGAEDADLMLARAQKLLAAGQAREAVPWLERVLRLRPADAVAKRLLAESSGTPLPMVDARVAAMNGVSIRVPAAWTDAPEDCPEKPGRLLSVFGLAPKSSKKDPTTWIQVICDSYPPAERRPDDTGALQFPIPHVSLETMLRRRGHVIHDSGELPARPGRRWGWVAGATTLDKVPCRELTGLIFTETRTYEVWYRCTAEDWDAMQPVFRASLESFAVAESK